MFVHQEHIYNLMAPKVVVPLLLKYIQPKSVLDLGCGTGTWLKIFEDNGISNFLGVDGEYVNLKQLFISEDKFIAHDLATPLKLYREFDLVLSLEVAEHLPESVSDVFIETLVSHGKIIIFSAAIPGQGGQNHINEQWPSYWQKKFAKYGYVFYDIIRPKIWDNKEVDFWYKQNIFLVQHESISSNWSKYNGDKLIHPDCLKFKNSSLRSLRKDISDWKSGNVGLADSYVSFINALKREIRKSITNKLRWKKD